MTRVTFHRRHACGLLLAGMVMLLAPAIATAQAGVPTLVLRPHCEEIDQTRCPGFEAVDPSTLRTPSLAPGGTLDLDVILSNPTQEAIRSIRIWLSYDAEVLEGTQLMIAPFFPNVVPGQADFVPTPGYAKIAASAEPGKELREPVMTVARLIFRVKSGVRSSMMPLSFYDQRAGTEGHTFVTTVAAPEQNLLASPLGTLLVRFAVPAGVPTSTAALPGAPTAPTAGTSRPPSAQPPETTTVVEPPAQPEPELPAPSAPTEEPTPPAEAPAPSVETSTPSESFGLIQVQNVRVGTRDGNLYVTWDPLSHPKLQGYNVYYGTLAGRYLQRRSVSVASRGAVIRDLPTGKTYYVAVRGVDDGNRETAFSAEISVEIGNPGTSSSPIVGELESIAEVSPDAVAPVNPVAATVRPLAEGVPGKSGSASALLLLVLAAAVIGTVLACRRQVIAARLPAVVRRQRTKAGRLPL